MSNFEPAKNFWKNLDKPFTILAPMDDVTDFVFREIVSQTARPDVFFTEFTCTDGLFTRGHDKVSRRLNFSENQRPVVAQIWGSTPENFFRSAEYIATMGFDGIDINMGCPDRAVIKKKSGSYLMKEPQLAKELIDATKRGAPNIAISVKTRITGNPESTKNWISFLLEQNLDALTIHARTPSAMSKGLANWEEIGNAVKLRDALGKDTVIIGNGDIKSYAEVLEKRTNQNVDGVMIGRGIFANPWVFEKTIETKQKSKEEYMEVLNKHAKLFWETWGNEKNWDIMKKFFKMYVTKFYGSDELRQRLNTTHNYEDLRNILNTLPVNNDATGTPNNNNIEK